MKDLLTNCALFALVTNVLLIGKWMGARSYYAERQRRRDAGHRKFSSRRH